jgi:hypothetical protein
MCSDLLRNIKMRKCNVPVNEQVDDAVMRWGSSVSLVCKSNQETTICISKCFIEKSRVPDLSKKKCQFCGKASNREDPRTTVHMLKDKCKGKPNFIWVFISSYFYLNCLTH